MTATESEAHLEVFFQKRVRLLGGLTIKLAPIQAGTPDRLVMFPNARFFFVELKTETGQLSPIQRVWHERVKLLGIHVHVLYGRDHVVKWLATVINAETPAGKPGRPKKPLMQQPLRTLVMKLQSPDQLSVKMLLDCRHTVVRPTGYVVPISRRLQCDECPAEETLQ